MTIQELIDLSDRLNRVLVSMEHEYRVHQINAYKDDFGADGVNITLAGPTLGPTLSTSIEHLNSLNDYQLYEYITTTPVVPTTGDGGIPDNHSERG